MDLVSVTAVAEGKAVVREAGMEMEMEMEIVTVTVTENKATMVSSLSGRTDRIPDMCAT